MGRGGLLLPPEDVPALVDCDSLVFPDLDCAPTWYLARLFTESYDAMLRYTVLLGVASLTADELDVDEEVAAAGGDRLEALRRLYHPAASPGSLQDWNDALAQAHATFADVRARLSCLI